MTAFLQSLRSPLAADLLVVALTVAAPALGATNLLWPKGLLLLGGAVAWLLNPPGRVLPLWIAGLMAALALVGFLPLLPAPLLGEGIWHAQLRQLGADLPVTFSLQPWLTAEKAWLLAGGLAWSWFLLNRSWQLRRRTVLELYAAAILLMVAGSVMVFFKARAAAPVGEAPVFGFFPNKNQMANLSALATLVALGLTVEHFNARHRRALFWLAGVGLGTLGVVLSASRGGLIILVVGLVVWLAWISRIRRQWVWLLLSVSCLLLMAGMLFASGAEILRRFQDFGGTGTEVVPNFRWLLQLDALPLLKAAGWHGVGLGNFEALFARYRDLSVNPNRAIHPESDWTWLAIEAGWFAPLLVLAVLVSVLRRAFPFAHGTDRGLRSLAFVCVILFIFHGVVDVSGHRIGTLWPALLLLALALPTDWNASRPAAWAPGGALVLGLAGVWTLGAALGVLPLPCSAELRRLKTAADAAMDQTRYADAQVLLGRGLRIAPADWELYFARGKARALSQPAAGPAGRDFALARYLEPNPVVAFEEGIVWLSRDVDYVEKSFFLGREPERAAAAWADLMQKHPGRAPWFYEQMVNAALKYPEIVPYLRSLAGTNADLLFRYLPVATGGEFDGAVQALLAASPDLENFSAEQRRLLFSRWFQYGDRRALEAALRAHPGWLEFGWQPLGAVLAARGDYEAAAGLARRFIERAKLPPVPVERSLVGARNDYATRPNDPVAAIVYVRELLQQNEREEAARVLARLNRQANSPDYMHALEADLAYDRRDFKLAWESWQRSLAR